MTDSEIVKIVVVEDEAVVLMLYKIKFAEWGFPVEVITAMNGFDGLLKIGRSKPAIVITDLKMPGMNGVQMITSLQQDEDLIDTKFIVASSITEDELEEIGDLPKNVAFLSKPVAFDLLESIIRSKLEELMLQVHN